MFEKNKKFNLKNYDVQRKEKVSVFGFSVKFDWMFVIMLVLVLVSVIFYFSICFLNEVKNYKPENAEDSGFLLEDKAINEKIDKILKNFSQVQDLEKKKEVSTTR